MLARSRPLKRVAARFEDSLATLALAGVILLPLVEIVVRRAFQVGIPGSGPFTQHLTMWVGLLGAMVAARDGKLLSLATGTFLPEGHIRSAAMVVAAIVGAAVSTILASGGVALVQTERLSGTIIAAGVPAWAAQVIWPIAFGAIAARLVWRASPVWKGRALAGSGIALGLWLAINPEVLELQPAWPAIILIAAAAALGAPIFVLLGGAAVVLFMVQGSKPIVPLIAAYAQLTSPTMATIPLFTLAGFLFAEGRASDRLLRLFRAWFGWIPGGTAVVTALLCAFFTAFTGGSGVTILALGGLLFPALLADRYSDRFSLGLLTASGSLGLLFPPALPLILYGIVANIPIEDLFVAGIVPGLLMLGLMAALGVREGLATGAKRARFNIREALAALWVAKWELLLPVVILTSLLGGLATAVESAALAALYAFVIQRYIHRDLPGTSAVVRTVGECVALVGGVLIILAVAVGLTNYLVDAQVPAQLIAWTEANVHARAIFLLGLNGLLLVVGCLMDIFSAIVVVVPLIVPIASLFDVDPVHLGIIFIANLELGYLTPPVGLNLFLSAYRFNRPVLEVARASLPMLVILAIGVLLITYVPWMTSGLLELVR
ncbi:MAG: TRAP transporter large permease subunit [Acidobacteria bacterium]|nr:TRAP transporter large permease subunit [Acidobacteriota bacterium]